MNLSTAAANFFLAEAMVSKSGGAGGTNASIRDGFCLLNETPTAFWYSAWKGHWSVQSNPRPARFEQVEGVNVIPGLE